MAILFRARTSQAYCWKLLAILFQNNIRTACFEITTDGIKLRMMDTHRYVLIDLDLQAENFDKFNYNSPNGNDQPFYIGINMPHFHKMLKCIKKKDAIEFYVDTESPDDLNIKVIPPKDNNRVTISTIKIQNIQNIRVVLPQDYKKPIIVMSSEYSKMCKDLVNIGPTITVVHRGNSIRFSCDAGSVYKRQVLFGDNDLDDAEDVKEFKQEFDAEKLTKITNISGLSNNIQIFAKEGSPLLFRSCVGSLGKLSIYIKSKDMIANDAHPVDDEDKE